jgi:sulfate transporter 3
MGGSAEANGGAVRVPIPPARPFLDTFRGNLKETFFPDDPFRGVVRERGAGRRTVAALRYFFPFLEWAPAYRLGTFKSDLIAGITIASLAIPQGISYAKLANLPPILGLCKLLCCLFTNVLKH